MPGGEVLVGDEHATLFGGYVAGGRLIRLEGKGKIMVELYLGADYDYVLVGTPSRRWGWILAREPNPSRQEIDVWLERLREQGYDPKAFVLTDQSARGAEGVGR